MSDWIDTERARLFDEADRRNRLAMAEEAARIERINAMLERSVWHEDKKPDDWTVPYHRFFALFLAITVVGVIAHWWAWK